MSRSKKKAIIKDRPRNYKKSTFYWRTIRSAIKNIIRSCKNLEDLEIPNPKAIVNDYNYSDYTSNYEFDTYISPWQTKKIYEEKRKKYRRK